jgi:hypothetical protein
MTKQISEITTKILSVLLIMTSCGRVDTYVEPELQPYLDLFTQEAGYRGRSVDYSHLSVRFESLAELDEPNAYVLGQCDTTGHQDMIKIDPNRWQNLGPGSREELMFHELGHCVLGRPHCDPPPGVSRLSIMDTYIGSDYDYLNNRQRYVNELFNPDRRCVDPD